MDKMKKKLVGGYIRVSTERQVEGYSVEGQIIQIEQYCQFNGYELVDIYADRGISGKSMNRPELQ
ncbi:recombinase family protein, partial [Staphylococcus carnosus]